VRLTGSKSPSSFCTESASELPADAHSDSCSQMRSSTQTASALVKVSSIQARRLRTADSEQFFETARIKDTSR